MSTLHASLAALALAFAGMAALALAMDRHYEQSTGGPALPAGLAWRLRCLGVPLLALAWLPAFLAWGGTAGTVAWLGLMSAAALLVVALLSARPRWAVRLACLAGALAAADLAWVAGVLGTSGWL